MGEPSSLNEGNYHAASEIVRRQMYVNFWFKPKASLRDDIGVDTIMWESDFPHVHRTIRIPGARSSACSPCPGSRPAQDAV